MFALSQAARCCLQSRLFRARSCLPGMPGKVTGRRWSVGLNGSLEIQATMSRLSAAYEMACSPRGSAPAGLGSDEVVRQERRRASRRPSHASHASHASHVLGTGHWRAMNEPPSVRLVRPVRPVRPSQEQRQAERSQQCARCQPSSRAPFGRRPVFSQPSPRLAAHPAGPAPRPPSALGHPACSQRQRQRLRGRPAASRSSQQPAAGAQA